MVKYEGEGGMLEELSQKWGKQALIYPWNMISVTIWKSSFKMYVYIRHIDSYAWYLHIDQISLIA